MLGVFYAYMEEYKHNDFFKDKTNLYKMYKTILHKTSECLLPLHIDMYVVKWMVFFRRFHKLPSENP